LDYSEIAAKDHGTVLQHRDCDQNCAPLENVGQALHSREQIQKLGDDVFHTRCYILDYVDLADVMVVVVVEAVGDSHGNHDKEMLNVDRDRA